MNHECKCGCTEARQSTKPTNADELKAAAAMHKQEREGDTRDGEAPDTTGAQAAAECTAAFTNSKRSSGFYLFSPSIDIHDCGFLSCSSSGHSHGLGCLYVDTPHFVTLLHTHDCAGI